MTMELNENTVILSIDSTSISASVALSKGHNILGEFTINHPKTHSQKLMPILATLFKEMAMDMSHVDLIAVSNGPGSFTGIRIGLATAKGLALPWNLPVAQVSSLMGLAYNYFGYSGVVCPMIDARRDEIYTALYRFKDGELVEVINEQAIHPAKMAELVQDVVAPGESVMLLGDGASKYFEVFQDAIVEKVVLSPPAGMVQRASTLASAVLNGSLKGKDLRCLDAKYIRQSQAEEEKIKKQL